MLSGLQDEATKRECNYHYGEEYVEKPVSLAELQARIEAVLRRVGKLARRAVVTT
jgi:DNA-binding response OmpR family regulator